MVLSGWALDIPVLKSILPGWFPMKANAALCFILTGVALFLTARPPATFNPQLSSLLSYVARLCALLAGLIGALTLGEYCFGWNLGIDQWLFREAAGAVGTSHPGRMAQEAALNFVLLSVALWLIGASRKTRVTVLASMTLGILVATLSLSATLSYLTPSLGAYGWFGLSIMALHAAITCAILSMAVIAISWQPNVLLWSMSKPITGAFVCGMVVLVFIGFTTSRAQFQLKETERQISYSEKVMGSTHDLMLEVLVAQSHTRGYVITGDDRFRANYLAAKADSHAKLELLRKLVADNPHQLRVLAQIEVPAITILGWFQQVIDARQSGMGADNRDRMVQHGENLLKNLTDTANQISISHRQHIEQLQLVAANASNNSYLILFTGTLTSLLIFLVTIFNLNVVERKRNQAEATLRDINANLEARVEERTRQLVLAKEAAEGSEFRWKFAIEGSGDGLWDWNVPQSTVFFSARWKEMLGFTEDEIGGGLDEWSKRVHPDDLAQVMADVQAHLDGTTPLYVNEHRVSCKDGSWKWILDRGLVVNRDSAGKPLRVIGTHTDISERRQAEEALRQRTLDLRERSKELRCLYEISTLGTATQQSITEVFEKAVRLIPPAWLHSEITCARILFEKHLFVTENFRQTPWKLSANIVIAKEIAGTIEVFYLEERQALDEGPFLKEERALVDELARILGAIVERIRSGIAIGEWKDRYETVIKASGLLMYDWSPITNAVTYAGEVERILGYAIDEMAGGLAHWVDLIDPNDRDGFNHEIERVIASKEPFHQEYRVRRKDGAYISVQDEGYFIADALGNTTRMMGFIHDITERKQAEAQRAQLETQLQQAQKMESVGRLAGGVAHDFNNMLTVILGNVALAIEQIDPTHPVHTDLNEIRKAANRSADLTRQLLAFARKQVVAPKVLDLNESVQGIIKMLQRLIGEDISLKWLPEANLWRVKVDPSQIDQILANLCINARDAITGVGNIALEAGNSTFDDDYCAVHAGFAPGDYVRLAVSDNGHGIDKETLAHIFEPFFTTKGTGEGTGLGLATVYGVVKQNNGFINVYSEQGTGTTFTIYLPRHEGGAEQESAAGAAGALVRGQETILLVEDEPSILKLTTRVLTRQGYVVLAANTPGEAIRLASEHASAIHLLMTDVVMPEMNGRDLAKNLQSRYPSLKLLFMSGYTANIIVHQGVLDQGVQFIQKPFSIDDLAAKVREVLDSK